MMGEQHRKKSAGMIMAHPDDETLWAGGTILVHPDWQWSIFTLCRGNDKDRAPKYFTALQQLHAHGQIADLDDGPEQIPLPDLVVQQTVLDLIDGQSFDLVITHGPYGEYSPSHRRHREVSASVGALWQCGKLTTEQLWLCAYDDAGGAHYPQAVHDVEMFLPLDQDIRAEKYRIIHDIYGFSPESWEANTTPGAEGFRCFTTPNDYAEWLQRNEVQW